MRRRILVADPDADVRSFLVATLRVLGYEPVTPEPAGSAAYLVTPASRSQPGRTPRALFPA